MERKCECGPCFGVTSIMCNSFCEIYLMVPAKGVDFWSHVCLKLTKTLRLQLSGSDVDTWSGEALKSESKEGKFRGIGAVIYCRIWAKADAMGPKFKGKSKLWRRVAFQRILTCRGKTGYTEGEKQRREMLRPQRGKKPDCW